MFKLLSFDLDFLHAWHWWAMLGVLVVHLYYQCVGMFLGRLTGLPRGTFGSQYAYALWFRALLSVVMLVVCGPLSVVAAVALCTLAIPFYVTLAWGNSYRVIMEYAGKSANDLDAMLTPYFERIARQRATDSR